jgi:hypothetical protein
VDEGDRGVKGDDEDRPWLDILGRKHECGPALSPYRTIDLDHQGKTFRVSVPDRLDHPERLEIRLVLASERHLTLIASYETEHGYFPDQPNVVLMVAHRPVDGPHVVHVWHDLYPWALEHLGLRPDGEARSTR